jgi:hypothetical protein
MKLWSKEKKWPIEGVDYTLFDSDGVEKITSVQILKGKFKDVVFHYGKVGIAPDNDIPRLQFDYVIENSGKYEVKALHDNEKFVTIMGDILVSIFDKNFLKKEKNLDEPFGTNNSEEFDLQ